MAELLALAALFGAAWGLLWIIRQPLPHGEGESRNHNPPNTSNRRPPRPDSTLPREPAAKCANTLLPMGQGHDPDIEFICLEEEWRRRQVAASRQGPA